MSTQTLATQLVASRDNVIAGPRRDSSLRRRFVETLIEWRRRINSRRELALLSELDLKDIGSPARAAAEKNKPFWRV
jgi:uncharacterized protein YjiS (DUF1127 family)